MLPHLRTEFTRTKPNNSTEGNKDVSIKELAEVLELSNTGKVQLLEDRRHGPGLLAFSQVPRQGQPRGACGWCAVTIVGQKPHPWHAYAPREKPGRAATCQISRKEVQEDVPFVWQILVLLGNHTSLQSGRNTGSHSISKRPAHKAKRCPPKR